MQVSCWVIHKTSNLSPFSLIWTYISVLVYALPFQPNRYGCHANAIYICTFWNIFKNWVNRRVAGNNSKVKVPRNRPAGPAEGGGVWGIALLFHDLGARRVWVVSTTPRLLYPRERPGIHCTGGWMGPRAGLDVCEKSRHHRDSIPGPSSPYSVAIPTELSRPQQ
jgi:hypothetical protein